ncbi:energy transducer TonB [Pseudobacteriovorax antillogorgiicola]|nr:energy transducer TonB [Pseudobacteriovorax antillogorgiicola]
MSQRTTFSKKLVAGCFFVLGPLFVVFAILSLNRLLVELDLAPKTESTHFAVNKTPKKTSQNEVKPKPKPKPRKRPDNINPNLDSILAGSSFGLESYEWLDGDALGGDLLDDIKNAAMTADTVEQPPVVTKTASLEYPEFARKKGIKGYVTINLLVTAAGQVEKTQVIESVPDGIFDQVALAAVKQWNFQPGMNKGRRVAVWVEQTIKFSLN